MTKSKLRTPPASSAAAALPSTAAAREWRIRPVDAVGLFIAASASMMILVNALMLQGGASRTLAHDQDGGHAAQAPASSEPAGEHTPAAANPLVKEVQAELSRRGMYFGEVDGLAGPGTEMAIRSFEATAGLASSGQATPQLLAALRQPAKTLPSQADVMTVQRALDKLGLGPLKADGLLGEGTRSAIRRFEEARGLPVRGEITPALKKELATASRSGAR